MARKLSKQYFHFVFSLLMGAAMVSLVTFVVTLVTVGLEPEFLQRWGRAFSIGFCVAVPAIYFLIPVARRVTARVVDAP